MTVPRRNSMIVRKMMAAAAGAVLTIAGTLGVSQAASATAADCSGGAHGFIDISDSLTGTRAPAGNNPRVLFGTAASGVLVRLEYGTVAGATRGWAHLYPTGTQRLLNEDMVWMDWTVTNGASWLQCGPFLANGKQSKTSAAKETYDNPAYRFRACAKLVGGQMGCTEWW
jgi:hypothetical protein